MIGAEWAAQEEARKMRRGQWAVVMVLAAVATMVTAGCGTVPAALPHRDDRPRPAQAERGPIAVPASPEGALRGVVERVLAGRTNTDRERLRKVEVVPQVDGGYGVFVVFNADDNLTTDLQKGGIELIMCDVYTALYSSSKHDVRQASVTAYSSLVDKYGQTSDGVVYKSMLDRSTADRVNWSADRAYLGLTILPGVWTTSILHQSFR